ncbi:MAG: glycosyltransferase [Geothrix sp.]|nr:glycosyltransferase [Geothrix sp.]
MKKKSRPSSAPLSTAKESHPAEAVPRSCGTPVIGVDARTLAHAGSCDRGIGHYTAHHLEALALEQPDWTFLLFLDDPEARTWALDRLLALANVQVRLMRDLIRTRMDLFHVPDLMGLAREQPAPWERLPSGTPYSVVFYDLIPLVLRKEFIDLWPPAARNNYLRRIGSLKRSKALILTISRHTKHDLAVHADIDECRMVPIMAGLNQSASASEPSPGRMQAVLEAQGLNRPFFLVVGALDPHKRFTTTLKAFAETMKSHAVQLVVVGSTSNPITRAYKEHFEEKGIQGVRFTGFLSREDLECLYRTARALVFPSAYEGFGFPVLEAMAQSCPVITSRASSLPEVAGDAALLVSPDDPAETAAAMLRLIEEPLLRETLIRRGLEQASRFSWGASARATLDAWRPLLGPSTSMKSNAMDSSAGGDLPARPVVRWEGSQFLWHSLAHVNRQLCLGLLRAGGVDLSLLPYERDQFDGSKVPAFKPLAACVKKPLSTPAKVHVRHQWPPNFTPPKEGCWVMIQPWEYGGIPQDWVGPMSQQVDEIWAYTTWVRDRYIESGVPEDRIQVIPLGVDTEIFRPDGPTYPLRTPKTFKFLFLGGTIYRKGMDLLLAAYRTAFTAADDVCLVIKGQGGGVYRGSDLDQAIRRLQSDPEAPAIEFMVEDLAEPDIASLYRACDAFVMPYRGEGFGLPMAEAMASGLPLIVTGRGAAMDFVHEDCAYLIPSHPVRVPKVDAFQPSRAGFWLEEPDAEALVSLMRQALAQPEERQAKGARGRSRAEAHLRWDRAVDLLRDRIRVLATRTPRRLQPPAPASPSREALLYEVDWASAEWVEVLLSYLDAFRPGEPVALVLLTPSGPGCPSEDEIQQRLLDIILPTGREAFPDIALVEGVERLAAALEGYDGFQVIPRGKGCVKGLSGPSGLRFARAREWLSGR